MSHLKLFFSFLLMIALTACNSGGGGVQTIGGGTNAVAARSAPLAADDPDCPTGGVLIETGIDENGNGVLDPEEVDKAEKVCNGTSGLVLLSDEDIGPNCPVGGVRVDTGVDNNGNGILDAGEITDTKFVCNPGRDRLFEAKEKLNAFDSIADAQFGNAVAISGDYAIVGVPQDPGGLLDPNLAGAAYIFRRTGPNTWDAGEKIVAPDQADQDQFGFSVSISGDYAIVGAYLEDPDLGAGALNQAGSAYIFRRTDTNTWDAGIKIVALDGDSSDRFGRAVAISGDYAIVGAIQEDPNLGAGEIDDAGAAYIFRRTDTNTWDDGTKLTSLSAEISGKFGNSVAISGDYAVVGAGGETTDGVANSGAAYIFKRTGDNAWDSVTKIKTPVPSLAALFGGGIGFTFAESSVAISGDYVLVGASGEEIDGNDNIGAAYVFKRTGDNIWDAGVKILAPDGVAGDQFGRSVAISGNTAIVGATTADPEGTNNAGAAYVFQRTDVNAWDAGTKIISLAPENVGLFGISVAISDSTAIVGARGEDFDGNDDAGVAYIVR